ncbi:MAG TPA: D-aminoacyl-tRNA deacylase [Gammaproteobacteria bacterium]
MIALLQRVSRASVSVGGGEVAAIHRGLLVFLGVQKGDAEEQADRLLERILAYRVFPDADGRMNLDLKAVAGGLLLVPQFTLAADTAKGNRPSFTPAAPPEEGARLFRYICTQAASVHAPVASGVFGADMQVGLVNEGPVTFWLQAPPQGATPLH